MRSLGIKLILAFLAVGLAGVGVIALLVGRATETEFRQFVFNQYQDSIVELLGDYYNTHNGWDGVEDLFPFTGRMPFQRRGPNPMPGGGIVLTDGKGIVLLAGSGFEVGEKIPQDALNAGAPIKMDETTVGWIITARDEFMENPAEAAFLDRIQTTLIIGAIGAVAVSLLLGILLTRTLTHPIRELTTATRAVAEGNYEQRVSVRSKDELGELATSFNLMSAELARSINLRRQMTADIAHELRTPISVILGHAEGVYDGVLPPSKETFDIIREEAQRLERMVEDLRILTRADAGELTLTRQYISPQGLLDQVATAYHPITQKKNITLDIETPTKLPDILVDIDRMKQVLGNLINNAIHYTPTDGHISLLATQSQTGMEFRVQDSGPGIEPDDLPHVFDRFYRTDKSRQRDSGGSGLGLAIAKSLVENHGGKIWVESKLGDGSTFLIRLPTSSMDI
ncbi:MAG: ATP-binding protein [Anaerolineales bacterium]